MAILNTGSIVGRVTLARRRRGWWLAFGLVACLAVMYLSQGISGAHDQGTGQDGWSVPTVLSECALAAGPRVAFPSESPSTPTGPGAIVWGLDPGGCSQAPGRWGPAGSGLAVAALGPTDQAMAASKVSLGGPVVAGLGAVGGSLGRITVAAALQTTDNSTGGSTAVLQGRSTQPLGAPRLVAGASVPPALTRGYLGDVAIATVVPGPAIAVRTERYFSSGFARARLLPIAAGRVTALTATMDYRSDVLLAWQQNGAIYAHMLRASGRTDPTQRVGPSDPYPQLQAVVSDNNHGIIAWSSTDAMKRSTAKTRIYLDLSAVGVRFRAPQLVASFADPHGVGRSPGSLELVRLSTENVMLAWTAAEQGHYVIRAAPVVVAASGPTVRLSDVSQQAVLVGLASGPAREAVALWRGGSRIHGGGSDLGLTELWAARAFISRHNRLGFERPEMIAAAAPGVLPALAVDPANDHAVAAWLAPGASPRIEYAVSLGAAGYRRRPLTATVPVSGARIHLLRITLGAAAAVVAVTLLGLALWRRRRPREV